MMAVGEDGVAAGHDLWQRVRSICTDLAADGRLDESLLRAYVFPVYERTVAEAVRPFAESIGDRLTLEAHSLRSVPNLLAEQFRGDGDAAAFAAGFTGFVRVFAAPSLREALALTEETETEIFARLESELTDDADSFRFEVKPLLMVISAK